MKLAEGLAHHGFIAGIDEVKASLEQTRRGGKPGAIRMSPELREAISKLPRELKQQEWIGAANNFLPLKMKVFSPPGSRDSVITSKQDVVAVRLPGGLLGTASWSVPVTPEETYDFIAVYSADGPARLQWGLADGSFAEGELPQHSIEGSPAGATAVSLWIDEQSNNRRFVILFRKPPF